MANVLLKRRINWDHLHGYVFNEIETLEVKGVKLPPMANFRREFVWVVHDGYLVRSPVRVNGVKVSKKEQADAEEHWLRGKKDKRNETLGRDMFFHFRFEPGSYLYAGKQMFDGRELVAIEYYPHKRRKEDQDQKDKKEDEYERMFEKTILVAVFDHGRTLGSADVKHGAGFGFFVFVAGFGLKVDFAHNLHDNFRVHFSTQFRF